MPAELGIGVAHDGPAFTFECLSGALSLALSPAIRATAAAVPETTVLQFVVDHVVRRATAGDWAWELPPAVDQVLVAAGLKAKLGPRTLATVRHRVAVLFTARRLKRAPNPCEQPAIRRVLSRAARASVKRGERSRKKTPITLAALEAMLATWADTVSRACGIAPCSASALLAAAGDVVKWRPPTCAICTASPRRVLFTDWSTARLSGPKRTVAVSGSKAGYSGRATGLYPR